MLMIELGGLEPGATIATTGEGMHVECEYAEEKQGR